MAQAAPPPPSFGLSAQVCCAARLVIQPEGLLSYALVPACSLSSRTSEQKGRHESHLLCAHGCMASWLRGLVAAWLLVVPAPAFLAAKAPPSVGGYVEWQLGQTAATCPAGACRAQLAASVCLMLLHLLAHAAAEGESEPYLLGDSDSLGDRGFQRATKKSFTFTSHYLGDLQRVRGRGRGRGSVDLGGPPLLVQGCRCFGAYRARQAASHSLPATPPSPRSQVHVQQVPHASDGSGVGWFLDRVEVSGPEGEHWSFPCSAWLGKEASHTGLNWGESCWGPVDAGLLSHDSRVRTAGGRLPKPQSPHAVDVLIRPISRRPRLPRRRLSCFLVSQLLYIPQPLPASSPSHSHRRPRAQLDASGVAALAAALHAGPAVPAKRAAAAARGGAGLRGRIPVYACMWWLTPTASCSRTSQWPRRCTKSRGG